MLQDFLSLFFPDICFACGDALYKNEKCICSSCIYRLPKTNYHLSNDNPVAKLFWGRTNINAAASYYLFTKRSKVQNLIHQLKYKNQIDIGTTIGKLYGYELKRSSFFKDVDLILPVPLHKSKLKKRGYNQSDYFALGLSESMDLINNPTILRREHASETQTKKSRFSRWKNVEQVFVIKESEKIEGKHILLVDDVVTTGSTLEACTQAILKIPGTKVSVATIAYAE